MQVKNKISECFAALKGSVYFPSQLDKVVRACLIPIFRYGAGLVQWTDAELDKITDLWCTGRRLAWKLPPGTSHCLHSLPHSHGGNMRSESRAVDFRSSLSPKRTGLPAND